MARPRKHDEETRERMIAAAEELMAGDGPDAVSVRGVADRTGTSTWAVYSLFGSREALLAAVAQEAMTTLENVVLSAPGTDDPAADLVEMGANRYRRFVTEHPWRFRLAFQRVLPDLALGDEFFQARARVWAQLEERFRRLEDAGALGPRTVTEAAVQFNALCEGLANAEIRGGTMAPGDQDAIWSGAFEALIAGFSSPARSRARRARRSPRAVGRGSPPGESRSANPRADGRSRERP